jgi:hypothetical protein
MVWQLKLNENCSKKYCIIQIPNTWSLTQYLNDKIKYTFWTWLFQVKICEKKCFLVKQKNVTVIDLSLDGLIEKLKNLLIQYLINLLPSSKKINRCSLLRILLQIWTLHINLWLRKDTTNTPQLYWYFFHV